MAFAVVLALACGKADYQKGEQLHLAVSGLASDEQQCLEFVGLLGSQVERIPPHTRDVLAHTLHEVIRTLPSKPEEILAKLQVLSGASAILHERFANRLSSWLEVKRLLEPEESVPASRWIPFGSRRTTALQRQKTLGPKLAEAISGVAGPESPNRRNVQHHISEAVDGIYALADALQCDDDLLPDNGKLEQLVHNVLYPPASKRLLPRQILKHKQVRKSAGRPGRPVPWFALLMLFVCALVLVGGATVIVNVLRRGFVSLRTRPWSRFKLLT